MGTNVSRGLLLDSDWTCLSGRSPHYRQAIIQGNPGTHTPFHVALIDSEFCVVSSSIWDYARLEKNVYAWPGCRKKSPCFPCLPTLYLLGVGSS